MIKFFVEKENITGNAVYIDDRDDVRHLVRVLRSKIGDGVIISDKSEWEYMTEIDAISKDEVKLRIVDKQKIATEPETKVVLYQGVPKGSKMETIIQKCVELGVDSIVPVFMERTIVVDNGSFSKKVDRWQKISDEAVKQCKRGRIPKVYEALDFDEMLEEIAERDYSLVLLPYENEEGRTIKEALREYISCSRGYAARTCGEKADVGSDLGRFGDSVAIIIGPEGGFDDREIQRAKKAFSGSETEGLKEAIIDDKIKKIKNPPQPKLEIVSLGKTVLRTETAGQTALAMVMYELEL